MRENCILQFRELIRLGVFILSAVAAMYATDSARADQEASNVPVVAAGPYGRCYVKSVPEYDFDPFDGPRQQGRSYLYRVGIEEDVLEQEYDWYAMSLFVLCGAPGQALVVRLGPWHRGRTPSADDLAIAFYRGGELIRHYSSLDIIGVQNSDEGMVPIPENYRASVSHYSIFDSQPEMVEMPVALSGNFSGILAIRATTLDGRELWFNPSTGQQQHF